MLEYSTQAMLKNTGYTIKETVQHWKSVERLAAETRLRLAERHRDEFDQLNNEFSNLLASESWLATRNDLESSQLLLGYIKVLAPYLRQTGRDVVLLKWCEDGLRACEIAQQNPGWVLLLRGEVQLALGHWQEGANSIRAAIESSETKDPLTHARGMLSLGRLQLNQGDYRNALKTLAEAESHMLELSDYEGVAAARSEMAAYYLNRQALDKALTLYREVLQLERQKGAKVVSDHTLLMLGVVHRRKRHYESAVAYLQQLLERGESQGNPSTVATAAHHLAWVRLNQGCVSEARHLCGRAMTLYDDIGDPRGASDAYEQLGLIALAEGRKDEALSHLERSLSVRQQLGNEHGVASSLRRLALVHLRAGRLLLAARELGRSLSTYWHLGVLGHQRLFAVLREITGWIIRGRWWTT